MTNNNPIRSGHPLKAVAYQQGSRTSRNTWWRGALAVLMLGGGFLLINVVLSILGVTIDIAMGRSPFVDGTATMTPALYAATLLSLAALTPLSALIQRVIYRQRLGDLGSVIGRFRWRLMARQALLVAPVLAVYLGLFTAFGPQPPRPAEQNVGLMVSMLALSVVLLPLQAAGEEVGFRGLLARIVGSWIAAEKVALALSTIVTSLVFMLAHAAGDPWLNVYYFCFGVCLSLVTYYTGGLEGAIVLHVFNNVFASVWGVFLSDLSKSFERGAGTAGPVMLVQVAVFVLLSLGVVAIARRQGAQQRTTPVAPPAPVAVAIGHDSH